MIIPNAQLIVGLHVLIALPLSVVQVHPCISDTLGVITGITVTREAVRADGGHY